VTITTRSKSISSCSNTGRVHALAARDCPGNLSVGQKCKRLARAGEWLHIKRPPFVGRGVKVQQAFDPLRAVPFLGFPEKHICEKAAAHPGLAVGAPYREIDPFGLALRAKPARADKRYRRGCHRDRKERRIEGSAWLADTFMEYFESRIGAYASRKCRFF
jgi:hypothetical protein